MKWNFKIGGNLGVFQLILCAAGRIVTYGFVFTGLDLIVDGFGSCRNLEKDPNLRTHSVKARELATDTMSIKYDQTYISPAQYLLPRAAINVIHGV